MRIRATMNRVEYQTRDVEIDVPDGTNLGSDAGKQLVWNAISEADPDDIPDWETISANEDIEDVEEILK